MQCKRQKFAVSLVTCKAELWLKSKRNNVALRRASALSVHYTRGHVTRLSAAWGSFGLQNERAREASGYTNNLLLH